MTMEARLAMLKSIVDSDDSSSTFQTYLQLAGQAILNKAYPYDRADNPTDVPDKYHTLQVEIAAYMMNKRGAEGETQHIENGIHRNYHSAYIPDDMLRPVVPYIGIPM